MKFVFSDTNTNVNSRFALKKRIQGQKSVLGKF